MSAPTIRVAKRADWEAIDALLAGAFPSRDEERLVRALREADDLACEHVAKHEGLLGHVAFARLGSDAGLRVAALAPLAVAAHARRRGVGDALVREGLAALGASGFDWCLVLGDPAYYGRFGFTAETASGFRTAYDGPYQQALRLTEDAGPAGGTLGYPPAFAALG